MWCNLSNLISIAAGLITLLIAIFTYISAKAARGSAVAASDSARLSQEMLIYEDKPFVAYDGRFNDKKDILACNIEGVPYYREFLFFMNYGKGAAILRPPKPSNPDLKADVGIPVTLGQGVETYITVYLPQTETTYETDLELFYWNIKGICYCTTFKCRIKHTVDRGQMLRVLSEKIIEIGKRDIPPEIKNWF